MIKPATFRRAWKAHLRTLRIQQEPNVTGLSLKADIKFAQIMQCDKKQHPGPDFSLFQFTLSNKQMPQRWTAVPPSSSNTGDIKTMIGQQVVLVPTLLI